MPPIPEARGELSEWLLEALAYAPGELSHPPVDTAGPFEDEDLQLSLYCLYELHYRGLAGVDERWEWNPSLLAFRAALEREFEVAMRDLAGPPDGLPDPGQSDVSLRAIADADGGRSLSQHMARHGTREQLLEFIVHRSAYQLKEADPHSWAIPRLEGADKAALVEVQADEYGGGRPERVHARLFADSMEAVGLDPSYGAYLDHIPAITLATVNLMSLFGLHRRLRGAIVGHLALFEMTSSIPNRRYGDALRRLGWGKPATEFFDEHVEADAVHENIAAVDMAGGLMRREPAVAADVLMGARALAGIDRLWADHLLDSWDRGGSSLRVPLGRPAPA